MPELTDNAARSRYEMVIDGETAFVTYTLAGTLAGERITLVHTEVPQALSGRGVGSTLAKAVLDDIRRRQLRLVPECTFIAGYIRKHPAFADLIGD
ncbi:MAG TPA: GNAT family N-acetyltransferase [Rhodopila sp.]|nr:GNAT family N-acetyltransferase [Rhodopila sp.]